VNAVEVKNNIKKSIVSPSNELELKELKIVWDLVRTKKLEGTESTKVL
jgi:hypothetical protein